MLATLYHTTVTHIRKRGRLSADKIDKCMKQYRKMNMLSTNNEEFQHHYGFSWYEFGSESALVVADAPQHSKLNTDEMIWTNEQALD